MPSYGQPEERISIADSLRIVLHVTISYSSSLRVVQVQSSRVKVLQEVDDLLGHCKM